MRRSGFGQVAALGLLGLLQALPAGATTIAVVGGSAAVLSASPAAEMPATLIDQWLGAAATGDWLSAFDFFSGEAGFNDGVVAARGADAQPVDDAQVGRTLATGSTPVAGGGTETASQLTFDRDRGVLVLTDSVVADGKPGASRRADVFAGCTPFGSAPGTVCDLAFVFRGDERVLAPVAAVPPASSAPAHLPTSISIILIAVALGGVALAGSALSRRGLRRWRYYLRKLPNSLPRR